METIETASAIVRERVCVCAVAQTTPLLPFVRKREHARSSSANMVKITIKFYALLRLLLIYTCVRAQPIYHTHVHHLYSEREIYHTQLKIIAWLNTRLRENWPLNCIHKSQRHVSNSVRDAKLTYKNVCTSSTQPCAI